MQVSSCVFVAQKRRSTAKVRSAPAAKVRVTAKGKAGSSRVAPPGVGVGKRAMAYRAKVTHNHAHKQHTENKGRVETSHCVFQQDMSDSDEEEEKSDSSDSDEDDETSGSTDSEDDDEVIYDSLLHLSKNMDPVQRLICVTSCLSE